LDGRSERESNDRPAEATPIVGEEALGSLTSTDADYFRLRSRRGQLLTFGVEMQGSLRPRLEVLDEAGVRLEWQPTVAAESATAIADMLVPRDGPLTLAVTATGAGRGAYRVRIAPATRAPAVLGALGPDERVLVGETIAAAGGRRWYRFSRRDAEGL